MNKLFLNSQGKNTARVNLIVDNKPMSLFYHLNDNPVQHIWQNEFEKNISQGIDLTMPTSGTLTDWLSKLKSLVAQTTSTWATGEIVTQEQLNALHTEFVNYMTSNASDGLSKVWHDINTVIHTMEPKLTNPLESYNGTVRFNIGGGTLNKTPIEEFHKLWLSSDNHWGSLLLGYDTLGKDWSDIWYNDDVNILADATQVQVQNHVGLETWMSFDIENPWKKFSENKFYSWYCSLTPEQQSYVPIESLNKIALGRYVLGTLIITDEFIKYNPNINDWYVINHRCKLEWNKDVISKVNAVENVEFFNSDMYYETLIKHTDTGNIFNA